MPAIYKPDNDYADVLTVYPKLTDNNSADIYAITTR